ncbi:M28 family peptidase [Aequorivita sp. CIP111184]|uniref:M28 family peptidase n=1 Tax=Aequorivita sp. CIP111184 TaxID=2211356 RepID=UPI000DBBFDFD|nr:M28 family peptidase [Aequorivita sp. CIP111184]SRX55270.1 Aminopeptidase YwaD [Aequorivita sp. CIP111184]
MGHFNFIHSGVKTAENYFTIHVGPFEFNNNNRCDTRIKRLRFSKMKKNLTFILCLFSLVCLGQNTPPQIEITDLTEDETAKTLTVNYSLSDAESDICEVWLKISLDDGIYFETIPQANITGDIGTGINPDPTLSLTWDYSDLTVGIRDVDIKLFASDNQAVDIAEMVSQVDEARLLSDLQFIEGERHYLTAPVHLEEVRTFIEDAFTDANLQTERQDFVVSGTGGTTMQNILGRQPGAKDEATTYVIDGHFDGVSGSPAADDNGSAVVGTLEALRILSQYSFEHSIRFIGFDAEESFSASGSDKYISDGIKPFEDLQGTLNMEMIGFYSDEINSQSLPVGFGTLFPDVAQAVEDDEFRGNFLFGCGNTTSDPLLAAFVSASETYVSELRVLTVSVPGNGEVTPDLRRSDHAAFWDAGLQALMLTDTADFRNLNYHTSGDTSNTLNFEFMRDVVKTILATAAELAVPISAGSDEADLSIWLSVEDHNTQFPAKVNIFPNPSNGLLSLRVENAKSGFTSQVDVYNLTGKRVYQDVLDFSAGTSNSEINLQHLANGSYILKLQCENVTKSIGFIIAE